MAFLELHDIVKSFGKNTVVKRLCLNVEKGEFISQEDLKNRAKISKSNVEVLADLGILEGMPATDQIELF